MLYVIGPAVAGNANLQQNDFVEGMPSPLASLGFAGLLVRRINQELDRDIDPWSARVMPIYHQISASTGRVKPAPTQRKVEGQKHRAMKPGEIAETLTGEVIFTLVIEIDAALDVSRLEAIVDRMRFAGSAIFPYGPQASVSVQRLEGATLSKMRIPRGYAMVPPSGRDRADILSFGEPESLDRMAEALSAKGEMGGGYLIPCAIGMRLLENPANAEIRKGTRNPEIPHVFAEAGVGFAELVSARSPAISQAHPADLVPRMWRWAPDPSHRHVMFSDHHLECL